jgi:hypothetical protein
LSEHVDRVVFALNRFVNRVDRVVFASNRVVGSRRWIAPQIASLDRVVGSRRRSRRWIASLDRAANSVVKSRRYIASSIASLDRVVGPRRTLRYIGLAVSGPMFSQFLSDRDDFYHFKIGSLNCSTSVLTSIIVKKQKQFLCCYSTCNTFRTITLPTRTFDSEIF